MSKSQTGTMDESSRCQQSSKSRAICSLVVVNRSQVHEATCTILPIERYIDSMRCMSDECRWLGLAVAEVVRVVVEAFLVGSSSSS